MSADCYPGQPLQNAEWYFYKPKVLASTQQHIILIQDGAGYHSSQAMNDFFALHADRLTKFQLPSCNIFG